jgi:hypothetical protein
VGEKVDQLVLVRLRVVVGILEEERGFPTGTRERSAAEYRWFSEWVCAVCVCVCVCHVVSELVSKENGDKPGVRSNETSYGDRREAMLEDGRGSPRFLQIPSIAAFSLLWISGGFPLFSPLVPVLSLLPKEAVHIHRSVSWA